MTRDLSNAREQNILPLSRDQTRQKTFLKYLAMPLNHPGTKSL